MFGILPDIGDSDKNASLMKQTQKRAKSGGRGRVSYRAYHHDEVVWDS